MKTGLNHAQLLSQLNRMSELAKSGAMQQGAAVSQADGAVNPSMDSQAFGNLLNKAIDNVNQLQMESARLGAQVEAGDGGVSLVKAMIASQKASVAFQATVQVRNKVVSAYQDIMNMPI